MIGPDDDEAVRFARLFLGMGAALLVLSLLDGRLRCAFVLGLSETAKSMVAFFFDFLLDGRLPDPADNPLFGFGAIKDVF